MCESERERMRKGKRDEDRKYNTKQQHEKKFQVFEGMSRNLLNDLYIQIYCVCDKIARSPLNCIL